MNKNRTLAISSLVFVSLGYLLMSVASRFMATEFGNMTQVYLRVLGAALVTSVLFFKNIRWKRFLQLSLLDWLTLAVMGVFGYGIMVYAIVQGALQTTLLNVSVLFSTVPIFVYFLGTFIFKRRFSSSILAILSISVWGVGILVSNSFFPQIARFGVGDWWVMLAAFLEANWFIGIKIIGDKLNSRELAISAQFFAGITTIVFALIMKESVPSLESLSNLSAMASLAFGIAQNIWAPLLTVYAFKYLNEVFATQLFLTENIWALVIGALFYAEYPSAMSLFGAAIVISSVYLMNKQESKV